MATLSSIPVTVEHEDGTETTMPMDEAVRLGILKDGIKVEVAGRGFVKTPEPNEGAL